MGVRACALALWCALAVAGAAAYTVDCNHEYTDCDTELSKINEDDEMPSASSISEVKVLLPTPAPFLPTVLPEQRIEKTTIEEKEINTIQATTTEAAIETEPTEILEQKENAKAPRLLNLNVDELQNFANALHNESMKEKQDKIDLSDVNMDDEEEEPPRLIPHDESKHGKPISDQFYTNLQIPFNPLIAMDRGSEEQDVCKDNGILYKIGEHIERGCEETCECQPGGTFDCSARCKHPYIRRGRRLTDPLCFESPVDECCSIIACATGNQDVKANKLEVCRYNNKTYALGEHWNIGCEQTCTCTPNSVVTCRPRCKKLIPSEKCINVQDPNDECCEVQVCDVSQDVHEEPENVTSSTSAPTSSSTSTYNTTSTTTTESTPTPDYGDYDIKTSNTSDTPKSSMMPTVSQKDDIGSIKVLQNNSVQVNLMHMNSSENPIHLLLSNDGGKSFEEIELKYSNLILDLKGGKDYILKSKETGAKFNFTITRSDSSDDLNEKEDYQHKNQSCYQDGIFYKIGEEFHIGCTELCECTGPNNERECVDLVCPSHVGLELVSKGCVRWAPSPPPTPPNCCPRAARCLSDGTCHYKGVAVPNWSEVPISLTGCEQRCFCENGELDCQEVCTPLPPIPPQTLRCPPHHRPAPLNISEDDCCKQWGCLPNATLENVTRTKTQDMTKFSSKNIDTIPLSTPGESSASSQITDDALIRDKSLSKDTSIYHNINPAKVIRKYMNFILPATNKPPQQNTEEYRLHFKVKQNNQDKNISDKKTFNKFKSQSNENRKNSWKTIFSLTSDQEMNFQNHNNSFVNLPDSLISDEAMQHDDIESSHEKYEKTFPKSTSKHLNKVFKQDSPKIKAGSVVATPNMFIPFVRINATHGFYETRNMAPSNSVPHQKHLFKGNINHSFLKNYYLKQPKLNPFKTTKYDDEPRKLHLFKAPKLNDYILMVPKNLPKTATYRIPSLLELDHFKNQMDIDSSREANRNLGRSANDKVQNEEEAVKVTPTPDVVNPVHAQAPFLPTVPPEIHFPTDDLPDYDQNNLHRPMSPRDPLHNIPPGLAISPNYGEENKKLTVLSIQADSPSSVKLLFGLPPVLVGLRGSVDLRYTDMADEDISHWYSQVFAPADEVLTTPRLEFRLTGLKPSTTYKIKGKLFLHNLPVEPESQVYSVRTLDPPTVRPVEEKRREIDSRLLLVDVNDTAAHVSWRHFSEDELQFIDGIQVRYRPVGTPIYSMTELLHHSRTIAELHELRPGTKYEASLILVPPPRATTELVDPVRLEFTTSPFVDPYNWTVVIEAHVVGSNAAELNWHGVPSPAERWVRVYRAAHACGASRHEHDAFRLATRDLPPTILLSGLEANTRCRVWMELFLTNGKIKTSNVLEINTKSEDAPLEIDNKIEASSVGGVRGEQGSRGDYYGALVVVGVVAALGALTSLLLLLVLVRRHRPRSVPITPVPSAPRESSLPPYDNPAYKIELQQETMDL